LGRAVAPLTRSIAKKPVARSGPRVDDEMLIAAIVARYGLRRVARGSMVLPKTRSPAVSAKAAEQ
jgi:hypothetical protein